MDERSEGEAAGATDGVSDEADPHGLKSRVSSTVERVGGVSTRASRFGSDRYQRVRDRFAVFDHGVRAYERFRDLNRSEERRVGKECRL